MNYIEIENKNKKLINISREYMTNIDDNEHNIEHIKDVVSYTKELIDNLNINVNQEVCIISAYWHDVGRINKNDGHEKLSQKC